MRAHRRRQLVEPRAAGDGERRRRESPRRRQMARRVLVEQQRRGRERKAGIGTVARDRALVSSGFVAVVQPVAVDEAVLQAGERDPAAPAFERERASPAAGFGVGDGDVRRDGLQCGRRFVHRARRPRKLQQRDAGELLADERPAVAAADDGVRPEFRAVPQQRAARACRSRNSARDAASAALGREPLDRHAAGSSRPTIASHQRRARKLLRGPTPM